MWKSYTEDIFLSKLSKLMTPWPGLSLNAIDAIAFLNSDEFIEVWTCKFFLKVLRTFDNVKEETSAVLK